MVETIIFLISAVFVILITIIEAKHDYWVIKFLYPGGRDKWKIFGNLYEICWIIFISAMASYFFNKWSPFLWILILWLIRWIVHDCFLGKYLVDDWFHLGNSGFDRLMKKIFQHGIILLIVKVIILIMATGTYFTIK